MCGVDSSGLRSDDLDSACRSLLFVDDGVDGCPISEIAFLAKV
jgi:hypothetical protein